MNMEFIQGNTIDKRNIREYHHAYSMISASVLIPVSIPILSCGGRDWPGGDVSNCGI